MPLCINLMIHVISGSVSIDWFCSSIYYMPSRFFACLVIFLLDARHCAFWAVERWILVLAFLYIFLNIVLGKLSYLEISWSFQGLLLIFVRQVHNNICLGLDPTTEETPFWALYWMSYVSRGLFTLNGGKMNYSWLYMSSGDCSTYFFPLIVLPTSSHCLRIFLTYLHRPVLS